MLDFRQDSFAGGFNQQVHPSKIRDDEYSLLINGRVRDDSIEPVHSPVELTSQLPEGKKQGIYSVGDILIVFVGGKGFYKRPEMNGFLPILSMQLDATVEYIYLSAAPASTVNFKRSLDGDNAKSDLILGQHVLPSPNCSLVEDGINQAWIILPNLAARLAQTYEQWQNNGIREYVPIGICPLWNGKRHYLVGKDSNLNNILGSVSGRPLDFMVNIQQNGEKQSVKIEGDAYTTAKRVDYEALTALSKSNGTNGAFVASTLNNSYLISEDENDKTFGEPNLKTQFLFNSGPLNNFSTIESLGNTLMITPSGVLSFNAVLQAANEGKNLPFSKSVRRLFTNIRQSVTCVGRLDNYVFLCVNTIYGAGLLIYDEIAEVFVSLDQPFDSNEEFVKMIATINTNTISKIYCITSEDRVYELYASEETLTCSVYLGEWIGANNKSELRCVEVVVKVNQVQTEGAISVTIVNDQKLGDSQGHNLAINYTNPAVPITILPFGSLAEKSCIPLTFSFPDVPSGVNVGVFLAFTCKCTLLSVQGKMEETEKVISEAQESQMQTITY